MRQHVDLAVLCQQINQHWFSAQIQSLKARLSRIELHELLWEQIADYAPPPSDSVAVVGLRSDLLLHAAVRLRRYDALLVPVSIATLGWTRRLLAGSPTTPEVPVIGVLHELRASAMIDLLELGMVDFLQSPVDEDEFKARVLCAVSRCPERLVVRDAGVRHPREMLTVKPVPDLLQHRHLCARGKAFNEAKSEVITQFETQYLKDALSMQKGNVTRAAAAAGKNRRAFWELMRKYQIDASEYRPDSSRQSGNGRESC